MLIKATLMLILTIALNLYVLLLQLSFLSSPVHQFTSQFTNSQFASSRQFASSPVRKSPVNQFTGSLVNQFINYTIWLFHLVTHFPECQSSVQHFTLHEFAIREISPVRQFASSPVRQKIKNTSQTERQIEWTNKWTNIHIHIQTTNRQNDKRCCEKTKSQGISFPGHSAIEKVWLQKVSSCQGLSNDV